MCMRSADVQTTHRIGSADTPPRAPENCLSKYPTPPPLGLVVNHEHDQVSIRAKIGIYYLLYPLLHLSSHLNLTHRVGSVSSRHGKTGLLGHVWYTAKRSDSD
jgi:hypothetical protein